MLRPFPRHGAWYRKLFWCLFFFITGGGTAFYVLHLLRPSRDESVPPAWGRAAKETFLPMATPRHDPPGVLAPKPCDDSTTPPQA